MFEKILTKIAPEFALKRQVARKKLDVLNFIGQNSGSGYGNSGGSNNANMMQWGAFSTSADSDLVFNRETLVQRSRDLYMSTPLANGALKTIASNAVGGGLALNANINYEYLGISQESAREMEKLIEFEFNLWANRAYNFDSAANLNFYQMQYLAILSVLLSGDVFVLLPMHKRAGSTYDLKVKLLEADRVMDPWIKDVSKNILGGIEIDSETGMPKYYYIVNQLPYAINFAKMQPTKFEKVAVFGAKTGRRNILHLFMAERPEQRRGIPVLSPVINTFKQLSRYTDAEITAAVISGMFSVFIKAENPVNSPFQEVDPSKNSTGSPIYKMQPGMVMTLKPGETIETADPGRPNTAFDGFVEAILKQIATSLELPYEYMMKKFDSSYSASRAAIQTAWQTFQTRRKWLVNGFCQPIYEEWLAEAVALGRINMPGFFDDPAVKAAWCQASFFGNSMIQIDPMKEVEAAEKRVEGGFSTRAREASELSGMNYDEIAKVREAEEKLADTFRRTQKPVYTGTVESDTIIQKQKM